MSAMNRPFATATKMPNTTLKYGYVTPDGTVDLKINADMNAKAENPEAIK
jgi:hypothetical protein